MPALIPILGALLQLLIVRIIIAMGITVVSYTGYMVALYTFKGYVSNAMSSMPEDIYNLLLIGGVGQGMGYLFGAFAFRLTMNMLKKISFLIGES